MQKKILLFDFKKYPIYVREISSRAIAVALQINERSQKRP